MYRTVLFRAKRVKADDPQERFIEGSLVSYIDMHGKREYSIVSDAGMRNDIQADTLGEFTGLKDKSGTPIFEGDIIRSYDSKGEPIIHSVVYDEKEAGFCTKILHSRMSDLFARGSISQDWINKYDKYVIGNIYDNHELLK